MSDLVTGLANHLWQASCWPAWRQFRRAAVRLEQVQRSALRDCLVASRDTEYGQRHRFGAISSVESFQEKVPVTSYEDYLEYVEAIGDGQPNVLTADPVVMFEVTSGSTAASKLIPVTRSLRSEFQRAIGSWITISPLTTGARSTSCGIPIGFEEDSAYLGRWAKALVDAALAVPNEVKYCDDVATFRYLTLLFLLRQPGLRLVSVWNPTFLSLLIDPLEQWWESLIHDLATGDLSPPGLLDPLIGEALGRRLLADPRRADALSSMEPGDCEAIWPHLGLVSCWMDAAAAPYAQALQKRLPGVFFQAKGLMSTEAFVSFPLLGVEGSVLAVTSHFYEFLPVDADTLNPTSVQPKLAHQLEIDGTYTVLVTTGGGLYRYDLRDVVQVVGHYGQAPCLRFLGKADKVSDWFGEKLDERFVGGVLAELFEECGLAPVFAMLAPDDGQETPRYTLYLELTTGSMSAGHQSDLCRRLDQKLRRSFHYDYCRRLGQLAGAGVFRIDQGAVEAYLRACHERGRRLGDVKPPMLEMTTGWGSVFSG